ncbi:DegQ family serine endoprotease [Pseudoxanthomonas helianthi]|uniref:Probable periplasmic serine endoprotease DegP-like n=1 Tax=Pseudoxanthomonas helianthi TaxID=1453541 RepID=A0A940X656_9GAMM|nr:DegQ family serine endoprotease [Pseudoxanthomonas helianthi]MBP3985672.1 DegQ family serine endoprotease [Pseudoxanthomonas helianthi]
MNPCVRNPLFGLLVLTMPLAACARPAADAAPASAAIASTIAQSSAPQIVTGLPDFTTLVQQVGPGVVNIEAKVTPKKVSRQQMPDDEEMPEFFRRFFGPGFQMPGPQQPRGGMSAGSGFIISPDGYVLTNQHVVDGADTVTVKLTDRREFKAKVVGGDPQYDVALLKIDATGLPSIRIGDSNKLKPGQWVVAIGSPFGMDHSVTAGIVSAVGRSQGADQRYVPFIQTDVAINPGNSGGPLLNTSGEVVGINSQIFSRSGGYMGISFAIPIDLAMGAAEQLKKTGRVERGLIGVGLQPITTEEAKGLGMSDTRGALIGSVTAGGAGEKAGLEPMDVIRSVNGREIADYSELPPIIGAMPPGTKVKLGVLRDGKLRNVEVTLTALTEDNVATNGDDSDDSTPGAPATATSDILGIAVAEIGPDVRKQLGLKAGEGVRIIGVEGDSAIEAGLQPGLIILQVGRTPVGSVAAFNQQLRGVKAGDVVMLLLRSPQGGTRFAAVTAGKD